MTRKIFALAICILTTILTVSAQTPPDNEIWYTTTDGKILNVEIVDDFNGLDSHYYENGKGVIRTTDPIRIMFEGRDGQWGLQFCGCTNLKTIIIPNAVEYISSDSFRGCTNIESFSGKYASEDGRCLFHDGELLAIAPAGLTSYTIPDSVTEIGWGAFFGCTSLKSFKGKYASADGRCLIKDGVLLAFAPAGLTSYTIPYGVTEIGWDAFEGCASLTSINIPNSVTEIRSGAFKGCTSLTNINIPDSVTEIGANAFNDCTSLTNITIPDSVTEIGYDAFRGCTSLKSFKGKFASADGRCLIKDAELIAFAPAGLTSYTIPYGVTKIGYVAFACCTSLTNITIPDSVTQIGGEAFAYCTSLTSITIPNSVTEIEEYAFSGCTSLTNITIPDSVTGIGDGAFSGCTSLTSVNIPNSVTWIGNEAFLGCTSLTSITIPDSVTVIGGGGDGRDGAFMGCTSLTSVNIPNSVTEIGGEFEGCTSLTSVNIPNSVTEIKWDAFEGCTSLTNITIPNSVTTIIDAFEGCTSLTNITIPDSVTEISGAFIGCTSLKSFKGKFASADGRFLIKDAELIAFAPAGLTSYTIPDSVTEIGDGAFKNCTNLTSITIPNSVTEIGYEAFKNCTSLTNITIPDSVTEIGYGAFEGCNIEQITINAVTGNIFGGCDGLDPSKVVAYTGKYASEDGRCLIKDGVLIDYIHNGAERYEIPNGVTIISGEVFKGCSSLKSITIPESVTIIRSSAFKGCTSLTDITMPNSGIGIEYSAFEGCNIEQITINAVTGNIFRGRNELDPSKVVAYTGKYASEDGRCLIKDGVLIDIIHTGLTSYDIPDGVTTIPDDTFRGCTKLVTLTLPQSLTTIGERAFMGCGITEITIPQGVATIGQDVFKECPLTIVINCLATTPPQIATLGITEEAVIYVPKESVKLYKKAEGWEVYKKQIRPIKE